MNGIVTIKMEKAFSATSILKFRINLFGRYIEKLVDIVQIFCCILLARTHGARERIRACFWFKFSCLKCIACIRFTSICNQQRKGRRMKGVDNKEYTFFSCTYYTNMCIVSMECVKDLSLLSTYIR